MAVHRDLFKNDFKSGQGSGDCATCGKTGTVVQSDVKKPIPIITKVRITDTPDDRPETPPEPTDLHRAETPKPKGRKKKEK